MTAPAASPARGGQPFAADVLDFGAVRERLARHTSFSAGRDLARELEPVAELEEARRLQAETTEALRLAGLRPSLHLGGAHDVRPVVERARVGALLRPVELLDVASTVRAARAWRRSLVPLRAELPTLARIAHELVEEHPGLVEAIDAAIDDAGEVVDAASTTLQRLRSELRGMHERLMARLRELMSTAPFRDVVQDPLITERSGRYVIPVRAEARGQVPGIVHDQSASGATLFVEPLAVVELGNRWRSLQVEEEREVERVLQSLSGLVGIQADALERTVQGLARFDLAQAKARLADEQRATAPELVGVPRAAGQPVLRLERARHPLLGGAVVPITLELGGAFDVLVITGPNTGGKTVALKSAGLLALMGQAGLYVPADEGSLVAVFRRVQADVGDEQSLEQSLSTFSSHITRIVAMLERADSCSLVLLDELGAGTDPQEGAALARAILDYLRERGAYVVATTHYPDLKAYAHLTPRVENASVEFDVQTLSPTYRLMVGLPGRSNALAVADRLGLPAPVLESARANLAPRTAEVEALLAEIAQERAQAEDARRRALAEAAEAATLKHRARSELRRAEQQRREVWEQASSQADELLAELRRDALRLRQQFAERGRRRDLEEPIEAALGLASIAVPSLPPLEVPETEIPEAAQVRPGAEVIVPRLGLPGRVLSIRDGEAEVEVLGRRVRMPAADLEGASQPTAAQRRAAAPEPPPRLAVASPRGDVPFQLDLRGLRREEALERLETYLEDAALAGMAQARVVHGKGTGAIRQAVREMLRASPLVRRFTPEPDAHGGDGATMVEFA